MVTGNSLMECRSLILSPPLTDSDSYKFLSKTSPVYSAIF